MGSAAFPAPTFGTDSLEPGLARRLACRSGSSSALLPALPCVGIPALVTSGRRYDGFHVPAAGSLRGGTAGHGYAYRRSCRRVRLRYYRGHEHCFVYDRRGPASQGDARPDASFDGEGARSAECRSDTTVHKQAGDAGRLGDCLSVGAGCHCSCFHYLFRRRWCARRIALVAETVIAFLIESGWKLLTPSCSLIMRSE